MSLEGEGLLTGLGIPHLHRLVPRSAGQAFAIRAEGHAMDCAVVPRDREEHLAGLCIPYLHRWVQRTAGHALSVWAVGHAVDIGGVPFEREDLRVAQSVEIIPFEAA